MKDFYHSSVDAEIVGIIIESDKKALNLIFDISCVWKGLNEALDNFQVSAFHGHVHSCATCHLHTYKRDGSGFLNWRSL